MIKTKLTALAAALMLLASCTKIENVPTGGEITSAGPDTETTAETTVTETETTTTAPPEPEYAEISFLAVGDNLIHSSIYKQAAARAAANGKTGYDFEYAYKNIEDDIAAADIAVINQETLICNGLYEPSTYPMFNSPPELGDHMLDIGFDVFTIANNHTLDKGTDGLSACLDYWAARPQAVVAGAYRDKEDESHIRTLEKDGVVFSFLAYTESLNGLSLPENSPLVIGRTGDTDLMCEQIKAAKEISDICVVALHWGVENSDIISEEQRITAKKLADAGADIIIGNHPHVLRDIEVIEREDGGETICAYSLGNFISAQSVGQNLIGGILTFDITVNLTDKSYDLDNILLTPIVTHYDGNYHDIRIYKLSEYPRELADSHGVRNYSKFGYDYIYAVLEQNISPQFLNIERGNEDAEITGLQEQAPAA